MEGNSIRERLTTITVTIWDVERVQHTTSTIRSVMSVARWNGVRAADVDRIISAPPLKLHYNSQMNRFNKAAAAETHFSGHRKQ